MRILSIAVIAAALATPSAGHPQDQRTIGGPMGKRPCISAARAAVSPGSAAICGLSRRARVGGSGQSGDDARSGRNGFCDRQWSQRDH